MDYSKYFTRDGDSIIFIGNTLEIMIPMRYESIGVLEMGESIKTLALFDMLLDGTQVGYFLPAKISITPHAIETVMKDGVRFLKATLIKHNVFIANTKIVADQQLAYLIFYELIYSGHTPRFINYDNNGFIFDVVSKVTGIQFPTDHVVFEMMTAMLHRSSDDLNVLYRHTDMKKPPRIIPLRMVSHAALSTTSKIVGSYDEDGIDAALVNASDVPSDIEDLLRQ